MFSTSDTIVAIATPPGRGGIGVVRLSGSDAHAIARSLIARDAPLEPRHATLATVRLKVDATAEDARSDRVGQMDRVGQAGRVRQAGLQPNPPDSPDLSGLPDSAGLDCSAASAVTSGFSKSAAIDQVVVTYFPAPASYTGDDVVELSAHGSPIILKSIVTTAIASGARLAEPGEFTLRAFINGRIDLIQAEAVADLVDAVTPLQARAAFDQLQGTLTRAIAEIDAALFDLVARLEASVDFPEEGYHFVDPPTLAQAIDAIVRKTRSLLSNARRGRLVREGLTIAIVGRPNVGKSSLFNALAGAARAIVTEVPGTTRDLVSETIDLEGLRVTLVDTAGLRETADIVELEGVFRARRAADVADLILIVADVSQPLADGELDSFQQVIQNKSLIVANKLDLGPVWSRSNALPVSTRTEEGLDTLRARIFKALDLDVKDALAADPPDITNVRHVALVQRAHDALARACAAALSEGGSLSEEFVLADLQEARTALEEVSGKRTPDDLLAHIFARFCIGK